MSDTPTTGAFVEAARLRALRRYRIVDTPPDRVLARVAAVAARAFDAPMGLVSVVDEDRIWLTGVHGIDADIPHIPRDEGLCEDVISGQASHVVVTDARTDARFATSQFVGDHVIRFYACAPMVTFDGHRIGSVAVMDTAPATPSQRQLALLEDLATIVMEQLELRLSFLDGLRLERRERHAAESARDDARTDRDTAQHDRDQARRDRDIAERDRDLVEEYATVLQQTLLPPSLPKIDGLSVAAHYHPADPRRVGGDFYDLFAVADDRWAFFIGDVQGHGAGAAVATSLIRYTLRSAALHYPDPTDVLGELNAVMLREADPRRFCTVLLGTLQPHAGGDGFEMTIATGGHPPALLIDPAAGSVTAVRSRTGMLVGATPNAVFAACRTQLRRGQTTLFYTDGLIEARRSPNPFDQDSLSAFARERAHLPSARLVDELATLIPKLDPDDDVAILALTAA
jgi:phosphoserine phosphatase RsbU/P